MIREELTRILKDARKQAGLSQVELARELGISQAVVSSMENIEGKRSAGVHVADRWLSVCGVKDVKIIAEFPKKIPEKVDLYNHL